MRLEIAAFVSVVSIFSVAHAETGVLMPTELSFKSKECIKCHKEESLVITQQWGASQHYRANVGCYECHQANKNDSDAILHYE